MQRALCIALGAVLLLISASCIPEAKNPVAPLVEAVQEGKLHGLWVHEDGNEVQYLHIGAEGERAVDPRAEKPEPGLMRFCFIGHTKDGEQERLGAPVAARFFVSRVGDERYVNAVMPLEESRGEPAGSPPTYWLMKYRLTGDELGVWLIDFQAAGKAVESGVLAGTVSREGQDLKTVSITATSQQLSEFLKSDAGQKLFVEENKLGFRKLR